MTYTYDPAVTNGNGRLAAVTNTRGTTTINAYDPLGRVTQLSKTIQGNATTYVTQYAFNLAGKQTRIIYPDNFYVTYNYYPGTGLLNNVVGSDGKTYGHYSLYEPTGKIGQINLYNNTATRYTYDPATTRLFGIVTTAPGGLPANDIQNMSYTYSSAGDITQIVNNKAGVTYNYAYDLLHRLIAEMHNGSTTAPSAGLVYGYGTAHVHAPTTIAINGTTKNFTYDQNGNMSGGHDFADPSNLGARTITYNADDKPVQINYTKGTTTSVYITYDGEGTRIKKTAGSSTTYYIGGHYEVKDGVATKHIMGASAVIASITGANTYYYHKDHLGSSTAMTDATGAVVESTDYAPYGPMRNHAGSTVTNYKYTDQELDPETGLYNYRARYYDPAMGMFISADTIVPQPDDPQSFNRYAYARNNPMRYVDPSGHLFLIDDAIRWGYQYLTGSTDLGFFAGTYSNFTNSWDVTGNVVTIQHFITTQEKNEHNESVVESISTNPVPGAVVFGNYTKASPVLSIIIKFLTLSSVNHAAMVSKEGSILESGAKGSNTTDIGEFASRYGYLELVTPNDLKAGNAAVGWLQTKVDTTFTYNYLGLIGLFNRGDSHGYICSEAVFHAYGEKLQGVNADLRVTPGDLFRAANQWGKIHE